MLFFVPRDVLDEILNLIESVSEGFPPYSCTAFYSRVAPDLGDCEIDKCEDKHRKAVVQQTYKVRREIEDGQFWFFGDFRCGALLFMVILVIYK